MIVAWCNNNEGFILALVALITGGISVWAIIKSPVHALKLQKDLEKVEDAKNRQIELFRALVLSQYSNLSEQHITALNSIDLDFYRETNIRAVWEQYRDYLFYEFDEELGGVVVVTPYDEQERIGETSNNSVIDIVVRNGGLGFIFIDKRCGTPKTYRIGDIGNIESPEKSVKLISNVSDIDIQVPESKKQFLLSRFAGLIDASDEVKKAFIFFYHSIPSQWEQRRRQLLKNLLEKMANFLGYKMNFDAYMPKAYADFNEQQTCIRLGAIGVLFGKQAIKVDVKSLVQNEQQKI